MVVAWPGVAGVADESDRPAFLNNITFVNIVGPFLQMGVIIKKSLIGAQLIDRRTAKAAVKEFYDLAVGRRENGRSAGRRLCRSRRERAPWSARQRTNP